MSDMKKQCDLDDVLLALQMAVEVTGSQAKCAEKLGVTQGYINDLLKRKREPGPKILIALGMRKVVIYEYEVGDTQTQPDLPPPPKRKIIKVPCTAKGCKRYIRGYLTESAGGGAFYSPKGEYLADLRNQEFRCPVHQGKK